MGVAVEKIIELINNVVEQPLPENIDEDEDLGAYGLDSITLIRVFIIFEDEFSIEFDDNDVLAENMKTISKIRAILSRYGID